MSLNVSLPPELKNRVRQHVESGLARVLHHARDVAAVESWPEA